MTNDWTRGVVALDNDGRALRGKDGVDRSVSAESLRVLFPVGAVVSVVVISHRQATMGQHRTVLTVLAAQDGSARNVSGMVASVTGGGRTGGTHGEPSRAIVRGYGRADHAAHALVADLAVRIWGSSTDLRPAVI
jgi:hypothetical protein